MTGADDILIRRYLLGDVTEEQQSRIEKRLLTDDQYFGLINKIEEDLIDDYVRGVLAQGDTLRFEQHFMSAPGRRESVEFARTLAIYVSPKRASRPEGAPSPAGRARFSQTGLPQGPGSYRRASAFYLSACAILLLVIVVGWLLIESARLRKQLDLAQVKSSKLQQIEERLALELDEQIGRNEGLAAELERAKSSRIGKQFSKPRGSGLRQGGPHLVSLLLASGQSRSQDEPPPVTLSPGVRLVQLSLDLGEARYGRYRAELQTVEMKTIWSKAGLKPDASNSHTVVITMPARLLTRSDYLVRLFGIGADGTQNILNTYHFKVRQN